MVTCSNFVTKQPEGTFCSLSKVVFPLTRWNHSVCPHSYARHLGLICPTSEKLAFGPLSTSWEVPALVLSVDSVSPSGCSFGCHKFWSTTARWGDVLHAPVSLMSPGNLHVQSSCQARAMTWLLSRRPPVPLLRWPASSCNVTQQSPAANSRHGPSCSHRALILKFSNSRSLSKGHCQPRSQFSILHFGLHWYLKVSTPFLLSHPVYSPGGFGSFCWYKVRCCRNWTV